MPKDASVLSASSDVSIKHIEYVASYIDELISSACRMDVSDIHIDPKAEYTDVKFRIAGKLLLHDRFKKDSHEEFVGRIKILSKMRTDVHDKNQDGRFYFDNESVDKDQGTKSGHSVERIDLRVSILPTFFGENIVIRVLRPELQRDKRLVDLGISEEQSTHILEAVGREQGIIIIAGPTGSGKTTTIYTILSHLSKLNKNIVTLEDPIEYVVPGIRQVQISEPADFGFSKALRALLRQDPDIIIIGEIRDSDTANLAFQASLTGHLVITTIHAEDCAGVYSRLSNLGVSKDMMHSLTLMMSQRLIETADHRRRGVFEVIPVEGKAKVTLFQNTFPEYIRKALQKQGVLLLEDSLKNIRENHE
ncbi:MAG: Flp pilus assembly complex ATPase component TadA [Candidatus Pacebacteria bacterium]|nr:Flp pilus assembly complex ATPase component TadA [Candidatus Paceibacterota bacterium]